MKVVSSQSEEDINRLEAEAAKARASDEMCGHLRILAANMMRTVRGAGDPLYLWREMRDCLESAQSYFDAFGHWPSTAQVRIWLDLQKTLLENRPWIKEIPSYPTDLDLYEAEIVREALQIAASRLKDDSSIEARARHKMIDAIRERERYFETIRKNRVGGKRGSGDDEIIL